MSRRNSILALAAGLLIAVALVAIWLAKRPATEPAALDEPSEHTGRGGFESADESADGPRVTRGSGTPSDEFKPVGRDEPTQRERQPIGREKVVAATDRPAEPRQREPAGETGRAPLPEFVGAVDAGTEEDVRDWEDPINRRVLGDRNWMAPIDDEESARIDEIFEKARAARFDPTLSREDRRTSIEVAREVVDTCFTELDRRDPGIEGRLIVSWQAGAEEGRGWIRNPRIEVNYKLQDPQFESCVTDGLAGRTYPAADGEPVEVEYPFFYDGY